jgi:hypothetical protein
MDACLYDAPKAGSWASTGKRQLSPNQRLEDPILPWDEHEVAWYGGTQRGVETVTGTALWHSDGQVPLPIRLIVTRDPQGRQKPAAFFATDPLAFPEDPYGPRSTMSPFQILAWYIPRWNIEVTFQEVRAHLGFETQRQWSELAIARTSPAILGLFSFIVLLVEALLGEGEIPVRQTAWYDKHEATFSDVIAFLRRYLWEHLRMTPYHARPPTLEIPASLWRDVIDLLGYAA